jgi:hypothetical protein
MAVATNSAPVRFCQSASVVLFSSRFNSPTTAYRMPTLPDLFGRIAQQDMFHTLAAERTP